MGIQGLLCIPGQTGYLPRARHTCRRCALGIFSPQNWIKAKTCLAGINFAIRNYFNMLPLMPGGKEMKTKLDSALALDAEAFEYRWAAD